LVVSEVHEADAAPTEWLASPARKRWHLHFTPTSASWLNLVERCVQGAHRPSAAPRGIQQRRCARRCHRAVGGALERRPQALRLAQDGRGDHRESPARTSDAPPHTSNPRRSSSAGTRSSLLLRDPVVVTAAGNDLSSEQPKAPRLPGRRSLGSRSMARRLAAVRCPGRHDSAGAHRRGRCHRRDGRHWHKRPRCGRRARPAHRDRPRRPAGAARAPPHGKWPGFRPARRRTRTRSIPQEGAASPRADRHP
jgi:hypothetical protein